MPNYYNLNSEAKFINWQNYVEASLEADQITSESKFTTQINAPKVLELLKRDLRHRLINRI